MTENPSSTFLTETKHIHTNIHTHTNREIFGPFYVYTTYNDNELPKVLQACEKMENHLTAAIVSNDVLFQQVCVCVCLSVYVYLFMHVHPTTTTTATITHTHTHTHIHLQAVLASTINGTTYVGRRARTTGAPQNHWFGPCGDPRGAGIGTPEAIKMVWSGHREVILDEGPIPSGWKTPGAT